VMFGGTEPEVVWFQGLGAQAAAVHLDRLGPEVLDERAGPGRACGRRCTRRSPIPVSSWCRDTWSWRFGPGRTGELLTDEGAHVLGDLVPDCMGAAEHARTWASVVEFGVDDAQTEPDELRPPDDDDDEPGGVPGASTVWWD